METFPQCEEASLTEEKKNQRRIAIRILSPLTKNLSLMFVGVERILDNLNDYYGLATSTSTSTAIAVNQIYEIQKIIDETVNEWTIVA